MKRKLLLLIPITLIAFTYIILSTGNYKPTTEAMNALTSTNSIQVKSDGYISFIPSSDNEIGIILYPGGKVEHEAYAPLMRDLADQGYSTFIAKMPLNLAIFGGNKADSIMKENNFISTWYIMGHSLGGVMASQYAYKNPEAVEGLILLASYPQKKHTLKDSDIKVLSILGDLDGLVDMETYNTAKLYLPDNTTYVYLEGANHGQMGSYGVQKKDLPATLTPEKQEYLIIEHIMEFIH